MSSWPGYFAFQMGKILNKKTIFKNHPLCRSNRFQKEIPKHLKKYAEVHDSIINFDPCTDFCCKGILSAGICARICWRSKYQDFRCTQFYKFCNSALIDHFSSYTFNSWFVGNCLEAFSIFSYFCLTVFLSFYLSVLVRLSSSLVHLSSS